MRADPAELVGCGGTRDDRVIVHLDVAGESHRVRENDMIADLAVMSDVRITKEQIVRPDPSGQAVVGATVDGRIFPENVVIANFEIRWLAHILEILGFSTDDCEGKKFIALPDFRVSLHHDMGVQHAALTQLDIRPDDAKWTDPDVLP